MRKQKIYIETTLFNYYFDTERDAHIPTVALFKEIAAGKYEAFTSDYVTEELEKAPAEKREKMISLINEYDISVLEKSDEAEKIADLYVVAGIIPAKYQLDGIHIAIASINEFDMIVSLNFKHIVKHKTIIGTAAINTLNGYKSINIFSPMEVTDYESDRI